MNLYNLRLFAPGHYQMAKFDANFNVEAIYDLQAKGAGYTCSCPAGMRAVKLKPCKHQRALPYMLGALNTDRFYDIELRQWHTPLAPEIMANADQAPSAEPQVFLSEQQVIDISADIAKEIAKDYAPKPTTPIVTRRI